MYNILLVDDEILAIEGIISMIAWEKFDIAKPLCVNSMKQAIDAIQNNKIDIMICDIQMPNGTGLDLLAWVSNHAPNIVTVLLTFHAKFSYVKEALSLGAFDYLLKPVSQEELETTLMHCIKKVNDTREALESQRSTELILKQREIIYEQYWQEVIKENNADEIIRILKRAEENGIKIETDVFYCPIMIHISSFKSMLDKWSRYDLHFALKNIVTEIFKDSYSDSIILPIEPYSYLIIVKINSEYEDQSVIRHLCETLVNVFKTYLEQEIICYIGRIFSVVQAAESIEQVIHYSQNDVSKQKAIHFVDSVEGPNQTEIFIDMSSWEAMLQEGRCGELLQEAMQCLDNITECHQMSRRTLLLFCQNFMQMIYMVLIRHNTLAQTLFEDLALETLYDKATYSLKDTKNLIETLINLADKHIHSAVESKNIIHKVTDFIDQNLSCDITRKIICDHVYIHPDYLSKIFRKVTGKTISEYIFDQRMARAKELLENTEYSVGEICEKVGYSFNSHFSKMFKIKMGLSPRQYRTIYKK